MNFSIQDTLNFELQTLNFRLETSNLKLQVFSFVMIVSYGSWQFFGTEVLGRVLVAPRHWQMNSRPKAP